MTEESFFLSIVRDVPIVSAPSDIDITNSAQLRAALLRAAALGPVVVADLSRTEFCDSSGLNVLVRELRRAQEDARDLRLVVRTQPLERILTVTGMDTIFQVFPTLQDALADHLDGSESPAGKDGAFPDGNSSSPAAAVDGSQASSASSRAAAPGWAITWHEQ
jgi:anti-sigma B factor antagonist